MSGIRSIRPDWNVPAHVHALVTLRSGGVSRGVYQSLNLATHVGDNEDAVLQNRQLLTGAFNLPAKPCWLNQTHSSHVIHLPSSQTDKTNNADAAWTDKTDTVCAVLTADCLAVFFYHPIENIVAVSHAGWRGLATGIIEKTIAEMTSTAQQLQVWMGPAIGANTFEVGEEVKDIFCQQDPEASHCFKPSKKTADKQYYLADIYRLAKIRLYNAGVTSISGGNFCTMSDEKHFFSYRRDGETGRMASLIWLSEH